MYLQYKKYLDLCTAFDTVSGDVLGLRYIQQKMVHSLLKKKEKAHSKSMLPITVKFGWVF